MTALLLKQAHYTPITTSVQTMLALRQQPRSFACDPMKGLNLWQGKVGGVEVKGAALCRLPGGPSCTSLLIHFVTV